jgi:hypothetical protein
VDGREIVPGGTGDMSAFAKSLKAYEAWLDRQLGRQIVKSDIARKHAKMAASPAFSRRVAGQGLREHFFDPTVQ